MKTCPLWTGTAMVWLLLAPSLPADDWPQWLGPQRDGVWREAGVAQKFPPGGPKVRWQADVGPGYSGPAIADGRVFLTDRLVRTGAADLRLGAFTTNQYATVERILCFSQTDGKPLWQREYPCEYRIAYGTGPRATPTVSGDQVYTLGAMGDLQCLETATGQVLWRKNFPQEYQAAPPTWGFASSPLVEGRLLITLVGGNGGTVMAFDKDNGTEIWRSAALSPKDIGYSAPILRTLAGRRQLLIWHPNGLTGLEIASGQTLWNVEGPIRMGLAIATPATDGDRVCVSSQYEGTRLVRLAEGQSPPAVVWTASTGGQAEKQWKETGLNTVLSPVLLRGDCVFGLSTYGELCALDAATGRRLWTTLAVSGQTAPSTNRWGSAFIVPNGDRDFIFSEKGELIIARLTRAGYQELDRAAVLAPDMNSGSGRKVIWSHPAFAQRCLFARNHSQLVCVDLSAAP